ncbi:hypothetical protein BKA64DRAFT_712257 [Cadophora sp. MPI-SDFR-AT-0126]|nr:hypothetical protein BKA64DRAFT_712257 [Leotiomycetes sp. MPI-SDFR-AT-0126]
MLIATPSKWRYSLAILLGICASLPSAYFGWQLASKVLASVQVSSNEAHWIGRARSEAYDLCYDGCNDCLDVKSIESACRLTAVVEVSGVPCDASLLWTWGNDAKYPHECLVVIGDIFKNEELAWKRFWYKPLYLVALLVATGIGFLVWTIALGILDGLQVFEPRPREYQPIKQASARPKISAKRQSAPNINTPLLATALLLLSLPVPVGAYACRTQPAHNALFSSPDNTLYGVIHGWISSCYDETYSCGESCTSSASSGEKSCDVIYCSQTRTAKTPRDFVNEAAERVTRCGFRMVDYVPGVVDMRVPNPRIEGTLWVKIAVNRFNVTTGDGGQSEVDGMVKCLYDIVQPPTW